MNPPSDSLSVLIQESDATLRRLISDVLATEGYRVIEAAEQDWLHLVSQGEPDLLLLDLGQPALTQKSSVHSLAVDDRWFDVSIVTLSGYAVLSRGAERYDVVGVLQKPFD